MGALVGSHIGKMARFDDENNYGPWRRFMRVRAEIEVDAPLQQELVIEREAGKTSALCSSMKNWGSSVLCAELLVIQKTSAMTSLNPAQLMVVRNGVRTSEQIAILLVVAAKKPTSGSPVVGAKAPGGGRKKAEPLMTLKVIYCRSKVTEFQITRYTGALR